MKPFYAFLASLIFLLIIIIIAQFFDPIQGVTGIPHPDIKGMMISPSNTDQFEHTRWLGYLWALGIISVFGSIFFIGNRKKGKVTSIGKWLYIFTITYAIIFTFMIFSNWKYVQNTENIFVSQMPIPTAWMIYGVWFFPLFITLLYMLKFEEWVISSEEEEELADFLKNR